LQRAATVLGCAAPALLCATLALAPTLGKAFTIDDPLFLRQAEHALTDPRHPTAFTVTWDKQPERMSTIMPSGPLMAWLLVPALARGASETLAHLPNLGALLLAAIAVVMLALRLGLSRAEAALAALWVVATPAVLGMASTCMPDVPSLAFGTLGIERFLAWKEQRRWHQALVASLALALALLARPHAVLLIGVAALAALDSGGTGSPLAFSRWQKVPRLRWLSLFAAPLLAFVVLRITHDPVEGGGNVAGSAQSLVTYRSLHSNLVAFPIHFVLALPLAIPWSIVRRRALWWRLGLVLTPLFVVPIAFTAGLRFAWLAPVAALGVVVLIDVLGRVWRAGDAVSVALGAWLLISLPVVSYIHLPAKYTVLSAPAAALLLVRELAGRRSLAIGAIGCGLVLGMLVVRADARFAGLGKRAAEELIAPRTARGERTWFAGHWGFQWYAEQAGGRCLTAPPPPLVAGDVIVAATHMHTSEAMDGVPRKKLLRTLTDTSFGGRVMSRPAGAGFFSNGWGYLPWSLGSDEIERFDVWQVE
jgi:hypothetical protein